MLSYKYISWMVFGGFGLIIRFVVWYIFFNNYSMPNEERILQEAQTLGYRQSFVACSLRTERACTIGYSWPPAGRD